MDTEPAPFDRAAPLDRAAPSDRLDRPDAQVAGHRLVRLLGRGGMGVVWEAQCLQTGALRAIKLIDRHAAERTRERFRREGAAQARADGHPHVARVHATGETPRGECWLVMDLLPGGDLAARLKGGPLPPLEAAQVVAQLARGLAHVHACGVLHRDIKPQNVLFDEQGLPRLVDFGLARAEGLERLTATGTVMGTPAYAAPEQLEGAEAVGTAADVYGLGALLYHALTGRPPFSSGKGLPALFNAVLHEAPRAPRALRPEIPRALERVCLACLAKEPADRPPDATALAEALEAIARGESPGAGRGPQLAIVALLLGAAGLAGLLLWPDRRVATGSPAPAADPAPSASASGPLPAARPSTPPPFDRERLAALAPHASGELTPELARELDALAEVGPAQRENFVRLGPAMQVSEREISDALDGDVAACLRLAPQVERGMPPAAGFLYRQAALTAHPTDAAVAAWGAWLVRRGATDEVQREGRRLLEAAWERAPSEWGVLRPLLERLLDEVGARTRLWPDGLSRATDLARAAVEAGQPEAVPFLGCATFMKLLTGPADGDPGARLREVIELLQAHRERGPLDELSLGVLACALADPRGAPDHAQAAALFADCMDQRVRLALRWLFAQQAARAVPDGLPDALAVSLAGWVNDGKQKRENRAQAALLLASWHLCDQLEDASPREGRRWLAQAEELVPDGSYAREWTEAGLLPR